MKRSGPIKRYTPVKKRRAKPRRGEPTAQEKSAIRASVYARSGGLCELHLGPKCVRGVLPFEGGVFERAHLVHVRSRGAGGTWEMDNLKLGCPQCHLGYHHTKGMKIDE